MKKLILVALLMVAVFGLNSCGSTSPSVSKLGTTSQSEGNLYKGDGGRGKRLAILAPTGMNLTSDVSYLPAHVQGRFVSDLKRFSAMDVLDRQSLEKVLMETESGYYKNEEDYLQVGQIANVGYTLTGAITKTASGFTLQIQIVDTKTGTTEASYTGSCTVQELDNFTGVKKASQALLTQMGVELTDHGREELLEAGSEQSISAETALAKGITAQKRGTVVEALAYYYQAVGFDPSLQEAKGRASVISANISSGNIGEDARSKIATYKNDLAQKAAWKKILQECDTFFNEHIPFDIVVNQKIKSGAINYANETKTLEGSIPINPTNGFDMIREVLKGLDKTGRKKDWDKQDRTVGAHSMYLTTGSGYFTEWPFTNWDDLYGGVSDKTGLAFWQGLVLLDIELELVNEDGKTIGYGNVVHNENNERTLAYFHHYGQDPVTGKTRADAGQKPVAYGIAGTLKDTIFGARFKPIIKPKSNTFSVKFAGVPPRHVMRYEDLNVGVNVNDISEKMTIKVVSVNGIDAETAGRTGYIKIIAGK
jgi:TolB-like protein